MSKVVIAEGIVEENEWGGLLTDDFYDQSSFNDQIHIELNKFKGRKITLYLEVSDEN